LVSRRALQGLLALASAPEVAFVRGFFRYAGAAPWKRAPWLLLRRPTVALSLAGTAVVLAVTAAATPLFVAAAGNAALQQQLDTTCPYTAGANVRASVPFQTDAEARKTFLDSRKIIVTRAANHHLRYHDPLLVSQYTRVDAERAGGGDRLTQSLVARDGFLKHIDVVQRWGPTGVWVTEAAVAELGLRRGTPMRLAYERQDIQPDGTTKLTPVEATLPIAGVYRDLARSLVQPFWCSLQAVIYPPSLSSDIATPSVVLMDNATFTATTNRLGATGVTHVLEFPLTRSGLTTSKARIAAVGVRAWRDEVEADFPHFEPFSTHRVTDSNLAHLLERAEVVRSSLRSTVGPVAVAGVIVALLLVAAAGSFWAERRREEVALLVARGVGPTALTAKAVLEMAPALVTGSAVGWGLAVLLVRELGPSPLVDPGAVRSGAKTVAVTLALGLLLLALVAGARFRAESERRRGARASKLALIPWELGLLAVAGVLLTRLVNGGAVAGAEGANAGSVAQIDPLLIAFPLVLLAGGVALALRALGLWLPRLGKGGESWSAPRYLAARRVAGARGVALLLAAASALPAGVLVYAASMTASVDHTVDAKIHVFTGSDLVAQLVSPAVPASLRGQATLVDRLDEVPLDGISVDVLGIDPDTFAQGAYWNTRFSSHSLTSLVERLTPDKGSSAIPVLMSGGHTPDGLRPLEVPGHNGTTVTMSVQVVGTAAHFPGESHGRPLVLVDAKTLAANTDAVFHQLWIRGDAVAASKALAASDAPVVFVQRASEVLDSSSYLPVTYAFALLRALALLTGAIGAGGLLLYLETRTRTRRVAYALARRMGLSRRGHLRSLLLEVGGLLSVGLVVGAALAIAASLAAYGRLDLDPYVPPGPLLVVPAVPILMVVLGTLILAGLAALAAQRSADRSSPAEVLRDAT
jgi:putative ABC transport system permease protein